MPKKTGCSGSWKDSTKDWSHTRAHHLDQKRLVQCFTNIKARCENPNTKRFDRYGGRGIKCRISYGQLCQLWERDKAWLLERPSIDRIDNDGDYTMENCRFIEHVENIRKRGGEVETKFLSTVNS